MSDELRLLADKKRAEVAFTLTSILTLHSVRLRITMLSITELEGGIEALAF